ncbi:tyrosine-protein phosphatase non-receptor type substrate 1-like isoform X2 [Tachysurus vachellii]|uniref:tyrosine-protein phosphatase non-receptor type substrate 1-like isoform X2 n=1 Tax=Tachysurus vachellii TaxID=175792 RepID=UPI00296AE496|nr:tyrosine-protein phosphatase non-receptor type substrate 1-like isoform X2 [Tachysurus vachellii]
MLLYRCTINFVFYTSVPVRRCFIYSVWILLCYHSAISTQSCTEVNQTESIVHHQISQGLSTTINCHYRKNNSQSLTASMRTKHNLCKYRYFNTSWTKQFCIDDIRFTWNPETKEISFQLLNLQINNSGLYTCTVNNIFPPPTWCLGQETIFIHVKAPPSVSVSCVNSSDGVPTLLCTSERFYPADLTQTWLRDGKYINYLNTSLILPNTENLTYSHFNWNYRKNTDGSYSVTSYLHLSSDRAVFYCWVNHSTLTQPITVNISSTECTERRGDDTPAGIICGMMAGIGLILSGCYLCFRKRTYLRSRVEAAPLPESVSHSTLGTQRNHHPVSQVYSTLGNHQPVPEIYSTLGNHQPVPQIYSALGNHQPVPCRNNSNDSTFPSL